jgi:RimJ/RimL family protein N-acetyltransferase
VLRETSRMVRIETLGDPLTSSSDHDPHESSSGNRNNPFPQMQVGDGYYCQPAAGAGAGAATATATATAVSTDEEGEDDRHFMDLEWGDDEDDSSSSNSNSFTGGQENQDDGEDEDEEKVPNERFEEHYDHDHHRQQEEESSASLFFDSWQQYPNENEALPSSSNNYRFRRIQPSDRQQIQELHEEWFPVSYQSDFYDDLVQGKMCHTGEDLYTNLVVKDDDPSVILACIVAAMVPASRLNRSSRNLLLPGFQTHRRACYIMTLGTVTEYRKEGLATQLVQRCMEELVMEDPSCGALYLHVIISNRSAIRFYDRLGFWNVQEIPDYYTIDSQHYNCYLYAKYFHGKCCSLLARDLFYFD